MLAFAGAATIAQKQWPGPASAADQPKWLAGIKAREMIDAENEDDDSWTPSMLDLTKLCATSDERSPTSVLLPGDLAPFDDRVHPNIPAR